MGTDRQPPAGRNGLRARAGIWTGPGLALLLLALPSPEGLPPVAWHAAAVACWMAIWWMTEAVPIPVTALLPLVLFPVLGVLPSARTAVFYGNHLIFLFLGGFVLALALESSGLHRRIALRVIAWVGGGARRILLGFMLGAAFLSMWMSNSAATLVMLPIGAAVVRQVARGSAREGEIVREFGILVMLGLAFSSSAGGIATLIGTPTNLVMVAALQEIFPRAPEIGFLRWMLIGLPISAALLGLIWWLLGWRVARIDLAAIGSAGGGAAEVRRELAALGPPSPAERRVGLVFAAAALAWVFRAPLQMGGWRLPGWSELLPYPGHIHDATVAMTAALLLLVLPMRAGAGGGRETVVTWETVQERTPWGILLLFGGGLALAGGVEASGLAAGIGSGLSALGALPPVVLVAAVALTVTFLTELTSNTATVTMLMPVLAATARGAGVDPLLLMLPATLSGSCAFMLPVATPPNAIVFGSGWVDVPRMARAGLWLNLAGAVLITLAIYLLARPVLGIGAGLPVWAR